MLCHVWRGTENNLQFVFQTILTSWTNIKLASMLYTIMLRVSSPPFRDYFHFNFFWILTYHVTHDIIKIVGTGMISWDDVIGICYCEKERSMEFVSSVCLRWGFAISSQLCWPKAMNVHGCLRVFKHTLDIFFVLFFFCWISLTL